MEQGIDAQAEESDVDVEVQAASSITDTSGQADRLNAMAQQGYGCYVVNPISGTNLIQGLAQIAATGTPVVNIDSPIEADAAEKADLEVSTYIGTDNVEAGKMGGEAMVEALGGSGKVALIGGISGDVTSDARLDGFKEGAGDLEIVQTVAADWDRQTAQTRATDILSANPDLTGFFSANDDMALGIARAVANAGKTGEVDDHRRRRDRGRPQGGRVRRPDGLRRAVPLRDRRDGCAGLREGRRRRRAPGERHRPGRGRHQGQRPGRARGLPGAVRGVREPPRVT